MAAETPFPRGPNLGNFERVITLGSLFERREQIRHLAERFRTGNVRVFGSVVSVLLVARPAEGSRPELPELPR